MHQKKRPQFAAAILLLLVGALCIGLNGLHANDSARLVAAAYWLEEKRSPEQAIEVIENAGPSYWYQFDAKMLLANAAAAMGDWEQAGNAAEQATKLQPQSSKPYLVQAIARAHAGQYDDELSVLLETGLELGPNQPFSQEAVATLAMLHWSLWPTAIQDISLESFQFMLQHRPRRLMALLRRNSASTLFCGVIQHRLDGPADICAGDSLRQRPPRRPRNSKES